jgi:hypothetical protein
VSFTAGGGGITMASGTTTSSTVGPIAFTASGPITIASLVSGGDVTIDATGGSILGLPGVTNITAGAALSLNAVGGTVGTAAAPIAVEAAGPAKMNATGILDGVAIAASGTVGSIVPLFPTSVVGAVLFNGVDLNAAVVLPPPVLPVVDSGVVNVVNPVIDPNAAQPALASAVADGSLTPSLGVTGGDAVTDVNSIIAVLSAQNVASATAALIVPILNAPPSTAFAELSTETDDPSNSATGTSASAVVRPVAIERGSIVILDGGMRLPAGLRALPVGSLPSPDAPSDSER